MVGFTNYEQFRNELLRHRSGPLASPIEEIADEMYQGAYQDEPEWDAVLLDDDDL